MAFDITSVLKTAPGLQNQESITYIDLDQIDPDPENFYSLDGLDDLAGNIELIGLQQPLRVRPGSEAGRYTIVSGHRRRAACMMIRDGGSNQFSQGVPCIIEYGEASDAMRELRLIYANASTRTMNAADLSRQAERVEALLYQLKEEGVEFPGRMREHVAKACQVSKTKLARLHAIRNNLSAGWLERFDRGELSEETAYQLSRLPADIQEEAAEWLDSGKRKKIPVAGVVEEVNRHMDRYLAEMPCRAHAGVPDCHHKNEKILRSLFAPYSWQVCVSGTCCRDCRDKDSCSGACQECKDRRSLNKAIEKENAEKAEQQRQQMQEARRRIVRKDAKKLLPLVEAAGLKDDDKLPSFRYWDYSPTAAEIRGFAAGDFGDKYFNDDSGLIPDHADTVKQWARLLKCSTDFLLGLSKDPAPAAVSGSDTVPGVPAWSTGTPPVSGLYVVKSGVPAEEGPQWTARRVIVWTGDQWVTNGPGAPFRDNVYAWFKIPED